MSWTILILIDILNIKAAVFYIDFAMNHLNINQYIMNMTHKWIHLSLTNISCMQTLQINLPAKYGKQPDFSKARCVMVY